MPRRVKDGLLRQFSEAADDVPQILWSADASGSNDYVNKQLRDFVGERINSINAETWISLVHPDDRPRVEELAKVLLSSAEPYEIEYRLLHHSGEYRWLRIKASPKLDQHGNVLRWYGSSSDIHDEKLAALLQDMVAGELDHRLKNLFALINGLVNISAREMPEYKPGLDQLRERISALSTAHQFLRHHETYNNTLNDLLAMLLLPYVGNQGADKLSISGDVMTIDDGAVTAFTLVFHELATNSAKYGALSSPHGKIAVRIKSSADGFSVKWMETSETIATNSASEAGFGSSLLSMAVARQLSGSIFRRKGLGYLCYIMRFPCNSIPAPTSRRST